MIYIRRLFDKKLVAIYIILSIVITSIYFYLESRKMFQDEIVYSADNEISENTLVEKIAQIGEDSASIDKLITIFGEPEGYYWLSETYSKEEMPYSCIAKFSDGFSVWLIGGKANEFRFYERLCAYRDKITIGSTTDEVFKVLGLPEEIYGDIPHYNYKMNNGNGYYCVKEKNIRVSFLDNKVTSLCISSYKDITKVPTGDINMADDNKYIFRNDPELIGTWGSFSCNKDVDDTILRNNMWNIWELMEVGLDNLYLDEFNRTITFNIDGTTSGPWIWSLGELYWKADLKPLKYEIKKSDGKYYLIVEIQYIDTTFGEVREIYGIYRKQ